MVCKIALEHISKETIDDHANINDYTFGTMLLLAIGYSNGCTDFVRRGQDGYTFIVIGDRGNRYPVTLTYDDIKQSLKGKGLTLTMNVHMLNNK